MASEEVVTMGMEVMIVAAGVVMVVGVVVAVRMMVVVIVWGCCLKRIRHPHPALSHGKLWERAHSRVFRGGMWEWN